jgi:hypothetical protein
MSENINIGLAFDISNGIPWPEGAVTLGGSCVCVSDLASTLKSGVRGDEMRETTPHISRQIDFAHYIQLEPVGGASLSIIQKC